MAVDAIVMENGRPYKALKRHLAAHGLTTEGYRQRFGPSADYPMTAPAYSEQRSRIAREIQLGVPGGRTQLQAAESRGGSGPGGRPKRS